MTKKAEETPDVKKIPLIRLTIDQKIANLRAQLEEASKIQMQCIGAIAVLEEMKAEQE